MSVDKVIIRTFLSTLAAIALLFGIMLLALVAFFPSTMMELTYNLGMDASSIRYAERAYDWHKDEYFIAHAMETAIGMKDTEKIEKCGERFIADEKFDEYCAAQNKRLPESVTLTYEQYVYGQVCVAKYENGDKVDAVARAFELTVGFPQNNAVVAVLYTAIADGDTTTIQWIREKMNGLNPQTFSASEKAYFDEVFALTNG